MIAEAGGLPPLPTETTNYLIINYSVLKKMVLKT